MSLEKRIIQAINMLNNIHHIDINKRQYKKINPSTLNAIKQKNIKINLRNNIERYKIYIHRKDCFAYKNENCTALKNIDCNFCKFYRNDITLKQIEEDIEKYCN